MLEIHVPSFLFTCHGGEFRDPLWLSLFSSIQISVLLPISCANEVRKHLFPSGTLASSYQDFPIEVSSGTQRILRIINIILPGLKLFVITVGLKMSWHRVNLLFWFLPPAGLSQIKSPSTFPIMGTDRHLCLLFLPSSPQFSCMEPIVFTSPTSLSNSTICSSSLNPAAISFQKTPS